MKASNELREKMWELCYGLLPDDERKDLVTTIKSDPQAARLYAEVRLQADLVGFAAKVEDSSLLLSPGGKESSNRDLVAHATRRSRAETGLDRSQLERSPWWAWIPATAALLLVGLIGWGAIRPLSAPQVASGLVVTEFEMPGQMVEGLSSKIAIRSRSLDGQPQVAEMDVKLIDAQGDVLHREVLPTDASGLAMLTVPGQAVQPGVRVEASARQPAANADGLAQQDGRSIAGRLDQLAAALPVAPQSPLVYYMQERPTALPGEPMKFALYNVSRFGLQVQAAEVEDLVVQNLQGAPVTEPLWTVDDNVLEGTVEVPEQTAAPLLELAARSSEGEQATARIDVAAGKDPVRQELVRQEYERQNRQLEERERLAGLSPAKKYFRGIQTLNKATGQVTAQAAGPQGLSTQAKDANLSKRQLSAGAKAQFGSQADEKQLSQTQPRQAQLSEFENGVANHFYDALGMQPQVVESGEPVQVAIPAEATGTDKQLIVTARARGVEVANAPVDAAALAAASARDKSAEADSGVRYFPFNLPPEASGEVQVQLIDASQNPPQVLREQVVFRRPTRELKLSLADAANQFQPGENVRLRFRVLDEDDQPQSAMLGVRVWNEHDVQATGREPLMVADVLRSSTVSARYDRYALADGETLVEAKKNEALVRGGAQAPPREPAPASPASSGVAATVPPPSPAPAPAAVARPAIAKAGGEAAETAAPAAGAGGLAESTQTYSMAVTPADAFAPPPPLVVTNHAAVEHQSQSLAADAERAWQAWQAMVGRVLVIGGLAALGGLLILFLVRMPVRAANGTLTLLAAAASLVVGAFWISGGPRPEVQIAAVNSAESREENMRLSRQPAASEDLQPVSEMDVDPAAVDPAAVDPAAPADQPTSPEGLPDIPAGGQRYKESPTREFSRPPRPASGGTEPPTATAPPAAGLGGYTPPANGPVADGRSGGFGGAGASRMRRQSGTQSVAEKPDNRSKGKAGQEPAAATAPPAAISPTRRALVRPADDQPITPTPAETPAPPAAADRDRAEPARGARSDLRLDQLAQKSQRDGAAGRDPGPAAAPASLYFNPRLVTDAEGYATIEFQMPAVESDYRVLIDAFGQGRIGSAELMISCRK